MNIITNFDQNLKIDIRFFMAILSFIVNKIFFMIKRSVCG
jgi:hypothetical protein